VAGLVVGAPDRSAVPHVTGVDTASGGTILVDLVVDMGGRRSALSAFESGRRRSAARWHVFGSRGRILYRHGRDEV
jgi:hypothetical protein